MPDTVLPLRAAYARWPMHGGRCTSMTTEQALQQAQAEGITLRKADNKTGYANVSKKAGSKIKPYMATWRWRVAVGSK